MLMRTDPFRELAQQAMGTRMRPATMPMDAYREGDQFVILFDLPGIEQSSIEMTVEKNVLTVSAERQWQPTDQQTVVVVERPQGHFSRQLFLGDTLDTDRIEGRYHNGVLIVTIPVSERAKPRKVEVTSGDQQPQPVGAIGHN